MGGMEVEVSAPAVTMETIAAPKSQCLIAILSSTMVGLIPGGWSATLQIPMLVDGHSSRT
jgi:hypothetical protein